MLFDHVIEKILNMKRLFIGILLISLGFTAFAQDNVFEGDTITRLGGKKMIVDVLQVNSLEVAYKYEGEDEIKKIERKQVQKIVYSNGRVEIFNKPIMMMVDETQWEFVLVTENEEDVQGLFNRGEIEAISSPSSRSKKAAKKSATIRLQKRTANRGGLYVLVTHKEFRGGYGEPPGYYMKGIVYGLEPLEEEEENSGE